MKIPNEGTKTLCRLEFCGFFANMGSVGSAGFVRAMGSVGFVIVI